jgi:hypothetical protein
MVTPLHAKVVNSYISDLKESVEQVRRNPDLAEKGGAAIYGMISQIPIRGMVKKNVRKMMMDMYGPDVRMPDLGKTEIINDVEGFPAPVDFATKVTTTFLKFKNRFGGKKH